MHDSEAAELLGRIDALAQRIEAQEAEIAALKAGASADSREPQRGMRSATRRDLLMAGVGMAVAATAITATDSAHADFRGTVIADAANTYGGLGAAGGNPGIYLPALGATTHGLIGVAEGGSAAPTKKSGVLGTSKTSVGVQALSASGFGVYARSASGTAVLGTSISKHGVRGECATAVGALDSVSVQLAGVLGISNKANGVAGVATGGAGAGVLAVSRNANVPALAALAATAFSPGAVITGTTTLNGSLAANGDASVKGDLTVDGDLAVTGLKSAAVQHPDGTHRLVYCVEAPEAWLEDFGEGTVAGGRGEVALDPQFAALCQAGSFHVFVTEHSDLRLSVSRRDGDGFTVEADRALAALKGLTPADLAGTFSYRVVARRKDNPGVRLRTFTVPTEGRLEAERG